MQNELQKYKQRKNPRLKNYDYTTIGGYFITICTKDRSNILSEIISDEYNFRDYETEGRVDPQLLSYGIIAEKYIKSIPNSYKNITLDNYVIMPNHIHMILILRDKTETSVSDVIGAFKKFVYRECGKSIFQKSFHDHIIRNSKDYERIFNYIEHNPMNWELDCFYK